MLAPSALAIDQSGAISVADSGNQRIARFTLAGVPLPPVTDTGTVRGIAVTPDGGRIYTTDSAARIMVWSPGGDLLDQFGGRGRTLGKLDAPAQIALDGAGNLWVADRGNNRVQQFALAAPAVAPCAALGAVGNPPAPKLPTLPEPVGPQLTVRPLRTSGIVTARNLPVRVGCDTRCTLTASASLTPRSRPPKGRRAVTVALGTVKRTLPAGESAIVRLGLSNADARRLRRALRGRRGLVARIQLTATADAGPPTVVGQRLDVRL